MSLIFIKLLKMGDKYTGFVRSDAIQIVEIFNFYQNFCFHGRKKFCVSSLLSVFSGLIVLKLSKLFELSKKLETR